MHVFNDGCLFCSVKTAVQLGEVQQRTVQRFRAQDTSLERIFTRLHGITDLLQREDSPTRKKRSPLQILSWEKVGRMPRKSRLSFEKYTITSVLRVHFSNLKKTLSPMAVQLARSCTASCNLRKCFLRCQLIPSGFSCKPVPFRNGEAHGSKAADLQTNFGLQGLMNTQPSEGNEK